MSNENSFLVLKRRGWLYFLVERYIARIQPCILSEIRIRLACSLQRYITEISNTTRCKQGCNSLCLFDVVHDPLIPVVEVDLALDLLF